MKRLRLVMLVAAAGLFLGGDAPPDAVKKELDKFKGTWKITSFEANGEKPLSDDQMSGVTTTIDADGKVKVDFNGMTVIGATIKIDPTKTPKTIDFTFTEGDLQGQSALGIYELTDDTYKYCRAAPGKPRPTEFSAKEGSNQTLAVYKREKAK
jgi:uncharacterized protein (TIGR03067 family)